MSDVSERNQEMSEVRVDNLDVEFFAHTRLTRDLILDRSRNWQREPLSVPKHPIRWVPSSAREKGSVGVQTDGLSSAADGHAGAVVSGGALRVSSAATRRRQWIQAIRAHSLGEEMGRSGGERRFFIIKRAMGSSMISKAPQGKVSSKHEIYQQCLRKSIDFCMSTISSNFKHPWNFLSTVSPKRYQCRF